MAEAASSRASRVGDLVDAGLGMPRPQWAPPRLPKPSDDAVEVAGGAVSKWRRGLAAAETVAMWIAGAAAVAILASSYERSVEAGPVMPGVRVYGKLVEGEDAGTVQAFAEAEAESRLDRPLVLEGADKRFDTTARALGARPAVAGAGARASSIGRRGDVLENLRERAMARGGGVDLTFGMDFDPEVARAALEDIAPQLDEPPKPVRMDLEARTIIPAESGHALLVDASFAQVTAGLAAEREEIELVMLEREPVLSAEEERIASLDIGVLLGEFSTPYKLEPKYRDRTHNLKLGASAIDGSILEPGEVWSFNETVGARGAEEGYRYAPGINAGELVDVLGGGICQVASSMFGASFFGGLEVVSARPHSRPSSYVDMGLDATVVWPTVDLKLKNTYDFPVVLHMTVNQGRVVAQVLGPRRPYQVRFERELKAATEFEVVQRADDGMRAGSTRISQRGVRGFELERRRVFIAGGEEVESESWTLRYPPTRQIEYVGTNPSGPAPEKREFPERREPDKALRILQ